MKPPQVQQRLLRPPQPQLCLQSNQDHHVSFLWKKHSTLEIEHLDLKRFTDSLQLNCMSDLMQDAQKCCIFSMQDGIFTHKPQLQCFFACFDVQLI